MTDIPIIFSGPMVRALLDGRKTMTRRLAWVSTPAFRRIGEAPANERTASRWQNVTLGDRLWVRENIKQRPGISLIGTPMNVIEAAYEADDEDVCNEDGFNLLPWWNGDGTLPCIHMPRARSRLTLVVTDTKIEPLQNITEADALAEGIVRDAKKGWFYVPGIAHPNKDFPVLARPTAREMFAALWDHLHGSGEWLVNPDIVAPTFAVHKQNIDALPKAAAA